MPTTLHSRSDLGLRAPLAKPGRIDGKHLTGHYVGESPWRGGFNHDRCAPLWRGFQGFHMDGRGWVDIGYNSGVCPHGHRHEGRGPGARSAANGTREGNLLSYATCYIAGVGDPLTEEAKAAFLDEAVRFAVPLNRWHSYWKDTGCPGDNLRNWIKSGAPPPLGYNGQQEEDEDMASTLVHIHDQNTHFSMYGERFREISKVQFDNRVNLGKLGGKPARVSSMHSWGFAKFVMDFGLLADPPLK